MFSGVEQHSLAKPLANILSVTGSTLSPEKQQKTLTDRDTNKYDRNPATIP